MQEKNSCTGNIIYVDQAKGEDNSVLTIHNLDANTASAIILIFEELNRAKTKHPNWPVCNIKRASIVIEEAGELIREANQLDEGIGSIDNFKTESIQTAAVALRLLSELGGKNA